MRRRKERKEGDEGTEKKRKKVLGKSRERRRRKKGGAKMKIGEGWGMKNRQGGKRRRKKCKLGMVFVFL